MNKSLFVKSYREIDISSSFIKDVKNTNSSLKKRKKSYTQIVDNYIKYTDIKPKNIYTKETNFKERYDLELNVLTEIIQSIILPKDVFQQIPEIEEFYPTLLEIKVNKILNIDNQILSIFTKVKNHLNKINSREYGEYYSSEYLIHGLLDNLTNDISINAKVIDPSSGGGFFLFYYLKQLLQKKSPTIEDIEIIQENIYGNDIFPFSIIISKLLLGKLLEKYDSNIDKPFKFDNIKTQNTLKTLSCVSSDRQEFDLIIGNPPYFRIDPHEENNICNCVSYGHNYIHNLFIHWSIQHLKNGGELAFIIPQSILSGFYYKKMRKEMIENLSIELIITGKEHEESFSVQQDIMLLTAIKSKKQSKYYNIGILNEGNLNKYSIDSKIFNNRREVIPLFKNEKEFTNFKILSQKSIVSELLNFKIGTGNFVWNQNKESCFNQKVNNAIPLINGTNITINDISLEITRKNSFSYCVPTKSNFIRNEKLILYRRMSPIGNKNRMIATMIDPLDNRFKDGYVIENHVNFISGNLKYLEKLLKFINSKRFNILLNSFCHTNQVSSNDLTTIFELLQGIKND